MVWRMTIDRNAAEPPWIQLRELLRGQIASGKLAGKLPSVRYLAQTYETSESLVKKALEALRAEGLVTSRQGWGWSAVPRNGHGDPPPPSTGGSP